MVAIGTVIDGKVVLDHPNSLPDGARVEVRPAESPRIVEEPRTGALSPLKRFVGAAKDLPTDIASNHDHHLYGLPKR